MDHYKFMRRIKQHLSLLLDEPAEKQMIRNLPHSFSSLYSSFPLLALLFLWLYLWFWHALKYMSYHFFAVTNCLLNMYNRNERVMLCACVSVSVKENRDGDRVKTDKSNNSSISRWWKQNIVASILYCHHCQTQKICLRYLLNLWY